MTLLSLGLCGKKQSYLSREDALVAASTRMRDHSDYDTLRPYYCERCKRYHLTKMLEKVYNSLERERR